MATLDELFAELDHDILLDDGLDDTSIVDETVSLLVDEGAQYAARRQLAKAKFMQMMASRQRQIRREAANDAESLVELVSRKQLSKLIEVLVKSDTDKAQKYLDSITRAYTYALQKWIPADIMRCYRRYKNTEHSGVIPRTKGFLHKNTPDWGNNYDMWVVADIPQYIPQFSEQPLVQDTEPKVIDKVNRAIYYYYQTIASRTKTELKIATDFYGVHTRYDLLQLNPDFYKIYMDKKLYEYG